MKRLLGTWMILALVLAILPATATAHTEDDPFTTDLLAGQDIDVGDVSVWNDGDDLYVQYESDGWCLTETHLHVATSLGGIPQTRKGNPIPGHFAHVTEHSPCVAEFTYQIPLDWDPDTSLYIAAHASAREVKGMHLESREGDAVYGPIYAEPDASTDWGTAGSAVRAYNWIGVVRDPSDPRPVPDCTEAPQVDTLHFSWGFGLNPNTPSPDIPGVLWISTAPNTEQCYLHSWRRFVKTYEVPGEPIDAEVTVNADDRYVLISNGTVIGSDGFIFNGPETYALDVNPGPNTLEFVTDNMPPATILGHCGDQIGNPNGLTYVATIHYLAGSESAWGAGVGFPGKNWATYLTYTVQDAP